MEFFEAQDRARRKTRLLVLLFILAVLAIIAIVYIVVYILTARRGAPVMGIDLALLGIVAGGVIVLVGSGSGFRISQLRRGGPAVAELLGGKQVDPETSDPAERRLLNVVEEMALASGLPVPAVYVLEDQEGINAFAAGHTPEDAAVAVTRGALEILNRDELQGVIAHEFSHISNGDMRINVRMMGLLFGLLLLAVVGRILLGVGPAGGRRRGGDGRIALIGLALIMVGFIGVFFGRLIQAAVSRQREYLADAAGVQFTRNPRGLAGALRKIRDSEGMGGPGGRIWNPHAEEANHFFFARGVGGLISGLFATHPPLEERIRRLDPGGGGEG